MSKNFKYINIPVWLSVRNDIPSTAKILYGMLDRYSYKEKRDIPLIKTLAVNIGKSERTVKRSLKELEKLELILVERRGRVIKNVYYLFSELEDEMGVK